MDIQIIENPHVWPYRILKVLSYDTEKPWPEMEIVQSCHWDKFVADYHRFGRRNRGKYPHMSFRQGQEIEWEEEHLHGA